MNAPPISTPKKNYMSKRTEQKNYTLYFFSRRNSHRDSSLRSDFSRFAEPGENLLRINCSEYSFNLIEMPSTKLKWRVVSDNGIIAGQACGASTPAAQPQPRRGIIISVMPWADIYFRYRFSKSNDYFFGEMEMSKSMNIAAHRFPLDCHWYYYLFVFFFFLICWLIDLKRFAGTQHTLTIGTQALIRVSIMTLR